MVWSKPMTAIARQFGAHLSGSKFYPAFIHNRQHCAIPGAE